MLIYIQFIYQILRDIFAINKPMMKFREIDIIDEVLLKLRPYSCFEYGCGFSSLRFSKGQFWNSIEHDRFWYDKMHEALYGRSAFVSFREPNNKEWNKNNKWEEGTREDFKDYVESFDTFSNFILVDGRARTHCLEEIYYKIFYDFVVVLHDANRERYHEVTKKFKYSKFFLDHQGHKGGIWIGSKTIDIEKILNIKRHEAIYKIYNLLGM